MVRILHEGALGRLVPARIPTAFSLMASCGSMSKSNRDLLSAGRNHFGPTATDPDRSSPLG